MHCSITLDKIDTTRPIEAPPEQGSLVIFIGTTRNYFIDGGVEKPVLYLEYECYEEMAILEMDKIRLAAIKKFNLLQVEMQHRIGRVDIGEASLIVQVSSSHRKDGFAAIDWIMDEIKQRLPVWKKEYYADSSAWKENPEWSNQIKEYSANNYTI